MGDIFLKLLNMSITASWLILAVLCIRFFVRKIPKWIMCLLWGVVAIRLIFPFSIESEFSLMPSAEPIKSNAVIGGEVMPYVPSVDSDLDIVENTVNPILAEIFAYQETESEAPMQVMMGIAGNVWLCGMIGFLIFAVVSVIRLHFSVREAVRYKANIYICDAVKSPFILGIIKPKIYLSSALSEGKMKYIIAHEKAHLCRCDHLWKPFGYLLLCIYWFNPLCWIAYMMLCRDIELACDEKVIKNMTFEAKKEYSRVLLSCATQKRLVLACPLAFGEVGVRERVKSVLNYKKPAFWIIVLAIVICMIVAVCFLTNPSAEDMESENSMYEKIVAELGDEDAYAFLEMNYENMVMLVSDSLYDTGTEKQAAVYCDIYYYADKKAKLLRSIKSGGTAYPITFTEDGIFVASGHEIEKYVISEEGTLFLEKGIYEQFDEAGNVRYISMMGELESESTEQEYQEMVNEYGRSQIVHFSYGAEGSVNEYIQVEESAMDMDNIQRELERVVSSVTLENAYPWNNTVELKENTDALIKMAGDETGRFEIYGIMSAKYGTYGLLLNDRIDGEQNWNYAYMPWMYSETSSDQPILEPDGNGKYIFTYVYKYEDDVPWWRECVLDCGYNTGHMELICQNEYKEEYTESPEEDTETRTSENSEEIIPSENETETAGANENEKKQEEYAENSRKNTKNPVKATTMVDTSEISSIVVTNGNTGEQITLTAEAPAYQDLRKLYWQLDFTAEYEENTRVGYQYSMKLLDKDGNKLQSVTPYKDGLIVDRIFYKYDNTGEAAWASLMLMEYLESVFE